MARYIDDEIDITYERERERGGRHRDRRAPAVYDLDSPRESTSLATLSPAYAGDYRDRGSLIRPAPPTVVEEPVIEHEHHHLHHHIDHGDVSGRQVALARPVVPIARPGLNRDYSYDDLDVDLRERRYAARDGVTVTRIQERDGGRHRHRHRHRRSRHGSSLDRSRYSRSDIDLSYEHSSRRRRDGYLDDDVDERDYTVIDVPAGSKRVTIINEKDRDRYADREREITWRRDRGVRRSRGLGNELWTEVTKDLVCREAIEDMDYPFEETDFFFYVFDYLDRDQIDELVDITSDIRRQRVRHLEYDSLSRDSLSRDAAIPRRLRDDYADDSRTEVIVEQGRSSRRRGNRYYNY